MPKAIIIAEAGVNHNGSLKTAKELIDIAAIAGADYVKFQTFKADSIVKKDSAKAEYQMKNDPRAETQYQMLKRLELSRNDHIELIEYTKTKGIRFLSTGFDIESIEMLMELGIELIKIPSGEISNVPLLRFIGAKNKEVILSTGMSTLSEIRQALYYLESSGQERGKISVLHCNTEYPTPYSDVNLKAMLTIADQLKLSVGYSDHTMGIEIPIAAVAMGARIVEKHFTLDRNLPGPDQSTSLEPSELIAMVKCIRNIEDAMGNGEKIPSASELKNLEIVRRSIVASQIIKKGEPFTNDNLAVKRPGTGISPFKWDDLIDVIAKRDYNKDDLIEW
jgi:N,N'-diacetyllegionaminate synthase